MRAVARAVDPLDAPPTVARFAVPGQVFLTPNRTYDVHAIAVFEGVVALQVMDDLWVETRLPNWYPAWLFDVVERALDDDWIVGVFQAEPAIVVGPDFVAASLESYEQMVELYRDKVDRFRQRISDGASADPDG
jgi:hypothetical protein